MLRQTAEKLRQVNETLEQRVAERTAQLRALAARLAQAEEQERRRMAQTLHDGLQQTLVAAALQLNVALRHAAKEGHPWIDEALRLLDEAIGTSRSLTAELSPAILHDDGLVPALSWLARRVRERYGLEVALEVSEDAAARRIPADVAMVLFQGASELLFNVYKHAGRPGGGDGAIVRRPGRAQADRGRPRERVGAGPRRAERRARGSGCSASKSACSTPGGNAPSKARRGGAPASRSRCRWRAIGAERARARPRGRAAARARGRKVRLLIVDDHAMVRRGLAQVLDAEPDLEVVGEAGDGLAGIDAARRLRPDVVLMDINMPWMDGIEATRRIVAEFPGPAGDRPVHVRRRGKGKADAPGGRGGLCRQGRPARIAGGGDLGLPRLLGPAGGTRGVTARPAGSPAAPPPRRGKPRTRPPRRSAPRWVSPLPFRRTPPPPRAPGTRPRAGRPRRRCTRHSARGRASARRARGSAGDLGRPLLADAAARRRPRDQLLPLRGPPRRVIIQHQAIVGQPEGRRGSGKRLRGGRRLGGGRGRDRPHAGREQAKGQQRHAKLAIHDPSLLVLPSSRGHQATVRRNPGWPRWPPHAVRGHGGQWPRVGNRRIAFSEDDLRIVFETIKRAAP